MALAAAPSHACSCVVGSTAQHLRWADAAFTGTLADIAPPPQREVSSSTDPNTLTFDVDRVYAGDVPSTVQVQSAISGASCGLEGMRVGVEYVVYATVSGDVFESTLCSGTAPARRAETDRLAALTGDPLLDPAREAVAAILAFLGLAWP